MWGAFPYVIKNWLLLEFFTFVAMARTPRELNFKLSTISSGKSVPHIDCPPFPVPVGSPPWDPTAQSNSSMNCILGSIPEFLNYLYHKALHVSVEDGIVIVTRCAERKEVLARLMDFVAVKLNLDVPKVCMKSNWLSEVQGENGEERRGERK